MDRYEVIIFWSADDDAFVAEAPELPGCAAHGKSHEEALANLRDAMKLWIDTARESGGSITAEDYIMQRRKDAKPGAFKRILDRAPKRTPVPGDEL